MANYDDSEKGGYSYAEKLAMVSKGLMDPKEIGMTSTDDAIYEITGLKKPDPKPWLSDFVTLEMSVIPLETQAHWARQDLKVIPTNPKEWEADWVREHQKEFLIDGILRSGSMEARFRQRFTEPILGFVNMIQTASQMLLQKYEEVKQANPEKPIKTREEIQAERRETAQGR